MARGPVDTLLPDTFEIEGQKFRVLRKGWPDCLLFTNEGKLAFIEEKVLWDKLTREQKRLFAALGRAGLTVYVYRFDGENTTLLPFNKDAYFKHTRLPRNALRRGKSLDKLPRNLQLTLN